MFLMFTFFVAVLAMRLELMSIRERAKSQDDNLPVSTAAAGLGHESAAASTAAIDSPMISRVKLFMTVGFLSMYAMNMITTFHTAIPKVNVHSSNIESLFAEPVFQGKIVDVSAPINLVMTR